MSTKSAKQGFSSYQILIIAILALLQFTIVLDFMVIAPLGALLMKILSISPSKFGLVVSAYAFSAGISGLLAAGFADKYDRKKLLLFFYSGFILGTILCALAPNYELLLVGRIVTGLFGGVVGSVSMAIITDLFSFEMRGRVMGTVQMGFAVSQIAGIPIGIYLANNMGWHAPFWLVIIISGIVAIMIIQGMKAVDKHLENRVEHNAVRHLLATVKDRNYLLAFGTTALLSIGGFLMMPFSSAFLVNNVGIDQEHLPLIFVATGLSSMFIMPLVGRLSDKVGKLTMFSIGTFIAAITVVVYTNLGISPMWLVVVVNIILFAGIMSRMIPATALMTAIPSMKDRGAFMGINASTQQIAGGIASVIAGMVIVQANSDAPLQHFDWLGYLCVAIMFICLFLMTKVNALVKAKHAKPVENMATPVEEAVIAGH